MSVTGLVNLMLPFERIKPVGRPMAASVSTSSLSFKMHSVESVFVDIAKRWTARGRERNVMTSKLGLLVMFGGWLCALGRLKELGIKQVD